MSKCVAGWMSWLLLVSDIVASFFLRILLLKTSYHFITGARWDQIDAWLSGRLAKSIDQTARIAAQLNHIELTMEILKQFVSKRNFNTFGSISFEIYCELADFIESMYPPVSNTIIEIAGSVNI
jgi:hypothetical protein